MIQVVAAGLAITSLRAVDSVVLRHERTGGSTLWGITQGDGRFITVGTGGRMLFSLDGQSWAPVDAGTTEALMGVTYAAGRFVVVGANGVILYSEDGMRWKRATASGTTERLNNVIWSEGLFVAVGEHGTIVTSTDAVQWTLRPSGNNGWLRGLTAYPSGGYTGTWTMGNLIVTISHPKFLAAGEGGLVVTSMDGVHWGLVDGPPSIWPGTDVEAVAVGIQGDIIATGAEGLLTSAFVFGGGTAPPNWMWMPSSVQGDIRLRGVASVGAEMYAFGEKGTILCSSSPRGPWTQVSTPTPVGLTAGVSLGNTFCVVGENETILQSVRSNTDRLINLSSRGFAGKDDATLISGFVVQGSQPKRVLLRAVGPGLTRLAGLSGVLAKPQIALLDAAHREIVRNADWTTADNADEIARAAMRVGAFPLAPADRDAALLVTLDPGLYTALVSPQSGSDGVCLIEVYDADDAGSAGSRAINISTRAQVGTGDNILIAGCVVGGNAARTILIRGVGPALKTRFGMIGALAQPRLTLCDRHGNVLVSAAAWSAGVNVDAIRDAAKRVGAFNFDESSKDSALLVALSPGLYTVQLSGVDGAGGTGLVELYDLP